MALNKTLRILHNMKVKFNIFAHLNTKYIIGNYKIVTPPNFVLKSYQKKHKLYDRFLPVLAKHINSKKYIIDVGANIGDTTVAMIQNCDNPIICIEPSDIFFPYLEKNIKLINDNYPNRVTNIKKLVGTGTITGELNQSRSSTASLKIESNSKSPTHSKLDDIIENHSNIILLKVDTDGFDFDVIRSAEKTLIDSEPILFWENEITEDFHNKGFNSLYSVLSEKGYKYIFIFDNFGNLIAEETNFDTLKNINNYVYNMWVHECTRTFYYTDILASTEKYSSIIKTAIEDYKQNWINK